MEDAEKRHGGKRSVHDIIEMVGMTGFHVHVALFAWWICVNSGWTTTANVYAINAATSPDTAWAQRSSPQDVLTYSDRSLLLLLATFTTVLGNPAVGSISDAQGRIFMILCGLSLVALGSILLAFATSKLNLTVVSLLNPFSRDGLVMVASSLIAEWMPVDARGFFIIGCHGVWNVGRFGVTLVWLLVKPEQHWTLFFLLAAVVPTGLFLYVTARGWQFESPRWLMVNGEAHKGVERLQALAETADFFGPAEPLPTDWDQPGNVQCVGSAGQGVVLQERSLTDRIRTMSASQLRLLCTWGAMWLCLNVGSTGILVWGMEYYKRVAPASLDAVMTAAPLGKILINVALMVPGPRNCIIHAVRRKPCVTVGYLLCTMCFVCFTLTSNVFLMAALSFLEAASEELIWAVGGVYMTEQFPTSIRNTAIGVILMCGSVGGVIISVLGGQLLDTWVFSFMLTMGAFTVVGFLLSWALPDGDALAPLADTSILDEQPKAK